VKIKSLIRRPIGFAALQFMTWATFAFYLPFVVVILADRGLSNAQIGLILMVNSMVGIITQPVVGFISDKIRSVRKVVIFCMAAIAAIITVLPLMRTTAALFVFMPLYTFFSCSIVPLLDNWTYLGIKDQPGKSYGSARLWGSIGFLPCIILAGRLVKLFSTNVLSIVFPVLCLLTIGAYLLQPDPPAQAMGHLHQKRGMLRSLGGLVKNYSFVSYVIFGGLLFTMIMPMNSFLIRLMNSVGGSQEQYSWAIAVNALSEIPVFFISGYLIRRYRPISMICVSSLFFILRLFLLSMAASPVAVIACALLQGPSFALYATGAVAYVDTMAPPGLKSTAQTLANAIIGGVSGIIGNSSVGFLIDGYGLKPVYRAGVLIGLAVVLLFFASLAVGRVLLARSIVAPVADQANRHGGGQT
jgi:MFS transporter, PPP family, 3-phenylpropionic acid transporter